MTINGRYQLTEQQVAKWIKEATLHFDKPVDTSTGPSNEYVDMFKVILRDPQAWQQYFYQGLLDDASVFSVDGQRRHYWPIGCGRSGSLIVGLLGFGTVWNRDKPHGIEWSGQDPPEGTECVIVDDILFTGKTLALTAQAAAKRKLVVKFGLCAWPFMTRVTLQQADPGPHD